MRKKILGAAPLLAAALLAQGVPAHAATPRAAASTTYAADANRTADQFGIWSKLGPAEWDEALEEGCIEDRGAACKMTAQQVAKLPADIKQATAELREEILANPAEQAELEQDRAQQTRAFGSIAGKITGTIAKFAKNPAVRKLADKADEIGEIAGNVTDATYAANGLTEGTEVAIAKSVIYMTPVLGDVFSLGEAIANGDVESGVVATVSLIGTAVGAAFPPAGAVVAVGLAIYYVAKMFLGWFSAKPRDWIADPPGTPEELYDSGAYFESELHKVGDKKAAVVLHTTGSGRTAEAVQTLLLDSKWTQYNSDRQPVAYEVPAGGKRSLTLINNWANDGATVTAWQGGKKYTGTCEGQDGAYECGLSAPLKVALGRPAVLKITYTYSMDRMSLDYCVGNPPCVPRAYKDDYADLSVLSESKKPVSLSYAFTYGIDR